MTRKSPFHRTLPLNLERLDARVLPSAALPFADGFESASLGSAWTTNATNNGRVAVSTQNGPDAGSRHVILDNSSPGILSRSELTLHVDLAGSANSVLSFRQKEFNDVDHPMPATFSGSINADGVALSVDGMNWKRLVSLTGTASQNSYQTFTFNLAEFAAANSLTLAADTMIRFQTYGNAVAPNGGMALDEISVTSAGRISGQVFQDANEDGVFGAGELPAPGRSVYLDADNDGAFSSGREVVIFSEQLPAPIFDQKRALYPLNVYVVDGYTVSDVKVSIALAHTYAADLDITLISPDGTRVLLSSDNGGSGDNYFVTRFDDDAAIPITSASAPFNGSFRPEGKLSDFAGDSFDGIWYLEIVDDAAGDSGTLAGWSIDLIQSVTKSVEQMLPDVTVWSTNLNGDAFSFYTDLDVRVNIDHPNTADLKLELVAAFGNSMVLSANNGGTGDNYANTIFDDSAAVGISAGAAPFTGRFKPQEPIGAFLDNLGYISGGFELRVTDSKAGSVAKIHDFTYDFISTFTAGTDPVHPSNPGQPVTTVPFHITETTGATGPITDIDVIVDLDHSAPELLYLEFRRSGEPSSRFLSLGNGDGGTGYEGTVFDDEAAINIEVANPPFAGSFRPEAKLSYYDGDDPLGIWNVRMYNTKASTGELNWSALVLHTAETADAITVHSILDQDTTTATLNVAGMTGSIADLDVRLNIQHTYDADLDVFLTAPNGKTVELFSDVGGNGDHFTNTILDDEAAGGIGAGTAPFTGRFRPESPLAAFDGLDPNGTWTLTINDDAPGDSGLLLSWSLIATGGERFAVTDANGLYSFENLAPGNRIVRHHIIPGEKGTAPATGQYVVPVTWGSTTNGRDFGFVTDSKLPTLAFAAVTPEVRASPLGSLAATFTEPVFGVDLGDFRLERFGANIPLAGATLTTSDNIIWTIGNLSALNAIGGDYELRFVSQGSDVHDAANNNPPKYHNPYRTWTVDLTPPFIATLTPSTVTVSDANVGPSGLLLTAVFNEAMDSSVTPVVTFPAEVPVGSINFNLGIWWDESTWKGYFSVADLDVTLPDIDVAVTGAKNLAGLTQTAFLSANLIDLDTQNPVLASITSTTPDGVYGVGAAINLTLTFTEPITLTGTLNVQLNSGAVVSLVGPQGGTTLNAAYIVGAGQNTNDLNVTGVTLAAGSTLRDAATNNAILVVSPQNLAATSAIVVGSPATVVGFTVNDGAIQRSRLTTITVNFSAPVSPASFTGLGAITLTRTAATSTGVVGIVVQTGAVGANGLITVTQPGPSNQLVLNFLNANSANETAGVEYGSLSDGRWQLTIPSAGGYQSTLNDVQLRRLFGDFEAGPGSNNTVDAADFATFGAGFGSSGTPGFSPFDYDNNGTIDSGDLGAFGARFGFSV